MPDLSSIAHYPLKVFGSTCRIIFGFRIILPKDIGFVLIYSVIQGRLKATVIFAVHLILVTWGLQGNWCPKSAMVYNLLFFICLLWAVHNIESDEPLQFALLINVLSIFFDVVTLAIYFPPEYVFERFSASFMIINLIVRFITSISLLRIGRRRGGNMATMFPAAMGLGRQDYEDISHPIPQNSDFAGV